MRVVHVLLPAAAGLALLAPAAGAATVSLDPEGDQAQFLAAPGETNAVTVTFAAVDATHTHVTIADAAAPVAATAPCIAATPQTAVCTVTSTNPDGQATVRLGDGDDTFIGAGGGTAIVDGEAGDDRLTGGPGRDVLAGGTGADTVDGGAGDDVVAADSLFYQPRPGHPDPDLLIGDPDTDADTVAGGDGNDLVNEGGEGTATCGAGTDTLDAFAAGTVAPDDCERLRLHDTPDVDGSTTAATRPLARTRKKLTVGLNCPVALYADPHDDTSCQGKVTVRRGGTVLGTGFFEGAAGTPDGRIRPVGVKLTRAGRRFHGVATVTAKFVSPLRWQIRV